MLVFYGIQIHLEAHLKTIEGHVISANFRDSQYPFTCEV